MPEPPASTTNQLPKFVGKYKIIRMIARSNDIVYEAVDPNLNRHIALKELILAPDLSGAAKRERIERFQREAKAAGALKHPNIVTIYEVGQHLEHRFIAMEYLEGQTLREVMTVGGPMSIHDALHIALQLCDALGYAHTQGVVHRDVKPDNVHLVLPNNTVKLTDFGIARVLTEPSITSVGQVFGTPSYMSPEQLTSRQVDHRTDIFSLGVTLFEMLSGKKPFRGDNVVAVTYNIMNTEVTMPPSIPPGIAAILTRALVKDPDLRYQNMRSLAADLRHELAFHDSPHHTPIQGFTPTKGSEHTAMIASGGGLAAQASEPTVLLSTAASGQVATAGTVAVSAPPTGSLLTAIDTDARVRDAVLRLIVSGVITLMLVGATVWSLAQCLHRLQENQRHARALVLYRTAISAAAAGMLDTAINRYKATIDAVDVNDPLFDRGRAGLSDCYVAEGARAQSSGDLVSAQDLYDQAVANNFNNPVAHYDLGTLYQSNGDQIDALREFSLAHQADPMSLAGIAALGQAQQGFMQLAEQNFANGNVGRARQNWQRVIELDPQSAAADQARSRMAMAGP